MDKLIIVAELRKYSEFIPEPTEAEYEACPDTFKCFACDGKFKKAEGKFGGVLLGEWLCTRCRPHYDAQAIAGLRRFDDRNKKSFGSSKSRTSPESITGTDWEWGAEGWERIIPAPPRTHEAVPIRVSMVKHLKVMEFISCHGRWLETLQQGFPGHAPKESKPLPPCESKVSIEGANEAMLAIVKSAFDKRREDFEEKDWIWVLPLLIEESKRKH